MVLPNSGRSTRYGSAKRNCPARRRLRRRCLQRGRPQRAWSKGRRAMPHRRRSSSMLRMPHQAPRGKVSVRYLKSTALSVAHGLVSDLQTEMARSGLRANQRCQSCRSLYRVY